MQAQSLLLTCYQSTFETAGCGCFDSDGTELLSFAVNEHFWGSESLCMRLAPHCADRPDLDGVVTCGAGEITVDEAMGRCSAPRWCERPATLGEEEVALRHYSLTACSSEGDEFRCSCDEEVDDSFSVAAASYLEACTTALEQCLDSWPPDEG